MAKRRVQVAGGSVRSYESVQALAKNEGTPYKMSFAGVSTQLIGTVPTANATNVRDLGDGTSDVVYTVSFSLPTGQPPIGKSFVTSKIWLYFDKKVEGFVYSQYATAGPYQISTLNGLPFQINAGETIEEDFVETLRSQQRPVNVAVTSVIVNFANNAIPAAGSTAQFYIKYRYKVVGNICTNDLNLTPDYLMQGRGDSNLYGAGASTQADMIAFMVRNNMLDRGINIRYDGEAAISGSRTDGHLAMMQDGFYNKYNPNILLYWLGTNDVIGSVTPATMVSNLSSMISRDLALYKNCLILVAEIPPRVNAGLEASNATARISIASYVNGLASQNGQRSSGNHVLLMPTTGAFSATDTTKYIADQLHINGTGMSLIWTSNWLPILNTFFTNNPTFLKK